MDGLYAVQNHLWYLSERLVPLALFSPRVSETEKTAMVRAMKTFPVPGDKTLEQAMPVSESYRNVKLRKLVGSDSWTFFARFGVPTPSFLNKPVSMWAIDRDFLLLQYRVGAVKVVNDAAERALGLITEFNTGVITTSNEQKEFLCQVVLHMRKLQQEEATSTERVTKKAVRSIVY